MMSADANITSPTDVVIIGGGIIGCSIAFRLAQAKLKVTVFDRGELGAEATSAAAGMLAPQGETIEPQEFSNLCVKSRDLYSGFVAEVEELSGESVGYRRDGSMLVGISDAECNELEEIHCAQAKQGLSLELLTGDAARNRVAGLADEIRCGLFVPGDHWVDNQLLAAALIKACRTAGVSLCPHSEVTRLKAQNGRLEGVEVRRHGGTRAETVSAGQFILAAGCWSRALAASLGMELPLEPCHGQIMELEANEELPHVVRAGMHYLVPRSARRVLAGTTAEYVGYNKAVTAGGMHSILEGISRIAPMVKGFRFLRAWAGLRPDTRDHLPVLGTGELEGLVFATGHFRNGILLAPITAQVISELVLTGSASQPLDLYRPSRFKP